MKKINNEEIRNWVALAIEETNLDRDTIVKLFVSKFGKNNLRIYNEIESEIVD